MSLMVISGQVYSGTVTFDQLTVSGDLTVSKYNADMNRIYQEFNSTVESSNIADDTLLEADFADEINPRVRTFEGASCEFVFTGLLPGTTSGTLTGSIPTGTAYPRGFRCDKTSSTPKTYTASKWTFLDIDQNCDFQFSEVAIEASTPAVSSNAIRIARVSSDGTEISNVQDLRTTSCTSGPFDNISDVAGEANLEDILTKGRPVRQHYPRGDSPEGWVQGLQVSFDTITTFIVKSGGAFINGKYRIASVDITVPVTADNPSTQVSGIDTGSIDADKRYFIYAIADKDSDKGLSVSFSLSSSTPSGVTNSRFIGEIETDQANSFTSSDIVYPGNIAARELIHAAANWDGNITVPDFHYNNGFTGTITDSGTGDYTLTFDVPMKTGVLNSSTAACSAVGSVRITSDAVGYMKITNCNVNTVRVISANSGGSPANCHFCSIIVTGDPNL